MNEHPESYCHLCLGPNIPWSAPSPLWNEVMRGGDINADTELHDGIVCPTCFATLAQDAGIAKLWRFDAERVMVPLKTTTPSGRVWNPERWKWETPEEYHAAHSTLIPFETCPQARCADAYRARQLDPVQS